jgi:hypothetical protein
VGTKILSYAARATAGREIIWQKREMHLLQYIKIPVKRRVCIQLALPVQVGNNRKVVAELFLHPYELLHGEFGVAENVIDA